MLMPDNMTLMAYADGELDAETVAEIEAACVVDASVQARLDGMLRGAAMARAAYDGPAHAPVPEYLVATVMAYGAEPVPANDTKVVPLLPRGLKRMLNVKQGWAAAAAIALFIGFGASQSWETYRGGNLPADVAAGGAVMRQAVNQALETLPNGRVAPVLLSDGLAGSVTPLRTFVNGEGLYCREYSLAISTGDVTDERTGVACRHGAGDWRPPEAQGSAIGRS